MNPASSFYQKHREGKREFNDVCCSLMSSTSRAIVIQDGKLELSSVTIPEPGPGYARVRIRACGVNRADLLQRFGLYPAPPDAPQNIPGLELAGEVEAIGHGVLDVKVGDRVFGIVGGGAYAEHVVVHARTLAPIPNDPRDDGKPLSFEKAAAIPEAFLTAFDAMVLQCGLSAGHTVLVHAVGSGVGTAAVQIAKAIGARAIGTARSRDKLTRAEALGLNGGVVVGDGATPKFAEQVRALTKNDRGVDVVLELVGGNYVPESLASLTDQGSLVLVGLMAGIRADVDLSMILRKRLHLVGTVLRSRPLEEKIVAGQVLRRHIAPLIEEGKLEAIVDKVFPLDQANAALDHMAANASFGKIVITT